MNVTTNLRPIAALVFVGGWVMAIAAYFIIGTETCATTDVPLVGAIETCTDTTSTVIVIVVAIGFAATVGSLALLVLSHVVDSLREIEANTRKER